MEDENNTNDTSPKDESNEVDGPMKLLEDEDTSTKIKLKSVLVEDGNKDVEVPEGWTRRVVMRTSGISAGTFDVYYTSPLGKNLRSKVQIENYCEETGLQIDLSTLKFSHRASDSEKSALFRKGGVDISTETVSHRDSDSKKSAIIRKADNDLAVDVTTETEDNQKDEPTGRTRRVSRAVQRYGHFDEDPDDPDSGPDMRDSDDDPEFTAGAKANGTGSDEEEAGASTGTARGSGSTSRGGRGGGRGRKRKSSVPSESPAKVQVTGTARRGRPASTVAPKTEVKPQNKDGASSSTSSANSSSSSGSQRRPDPATTTYKNGDYLIAIKDIPEFRDGLNPPIWRIDGKSLLQKFTHFEKDGKIQYKNIPTYSGWTPASYNQYTAVKTKFVFQTKKDTTLELIDVIENGNEAPPPERPKENREWSNPIESRDYEIPDEMRLNKNAFKIYIQALISNALDNTFLKDVYDDNDDYFPPAIRKIENQAISRRNKLLEVSTWADDYKRAIDTWPCASIKYQVNESCSACNSPKATKLVQFYGRSYDNDSLADRPSENGLRMKWTLCERCGVITSLYNKITHLKYEHFDQCKIQVTNMRVLFPEEDTRVVEELLEHREYVTTLFKTMCQNNVRADKFYSAEKDRLGRG